MGTARILHSKILANFCRPSRLTTQRDGLGPDQSPLKTSPLDLLRAVGAHYVELKGGDMRSLALIGTCILSQLFWTSANAEQHFTVSTSSNVNILYSEPGNKLGVLYVEYHLPGSNNWHYAVRAVVKVPGTMYSATINSTSLQSACGAQPSSICEVVVSAYTPNSNGVAVPFASDLLMGGGGIYVVDFFTVPGPPIGAGPDISVIVNQTGSGQMPMSYTLRSTAGNSCSESGPPPCGPCMANCPSGHVAYCTPGTVFWDNGPGGPPGSPPGIPHQICEAQPVCRCGP